MIRTRLATVVDTGDRWPGAIELTVEVAGEGRLPALAYPALTGEPRPGDHAVVSTGPLALGLGTGGYALVVHVDGRAAPDPGPGRMVKARYTPQQVLVCGVEEEDSPHRPLMTSIDDVSGLPVVTADLHSALPAVLTGLRSGPQALRAVYVMSDAAALPLWFSRTVAGLSAAGWLAGTVTTGQAFGGDLEAATLHSGLLAARAVLAADVAVVAPGPGGLGTGTRFGFSGVAAGEAVNAVAVLAGRPVASLRISGADPRERHHGLSHHSLTAYARVALAPADVPIPATEVELLSDHVVAGMLGARHRIVPVETAGLAEALAACPVELSTMGRGLADDPRYFLAAAAAGRHAAALATSTR